MPVIMSPVTKVSFYLLAKGFGVMYDNHCKFICERK